MSAYPDKDSTPVDEPENYIVVREHSGQWVRTVANKWVIDEGVLTLWRKVDNDPKSTAAKWVGTWPVGAWSGVKPVSMDWVPVSDDEANNSRPARPTVHTDNGGYS